MEHNPAIPWSAPHRRACASCQAWEARQGEKLAEALLGELNRVLVDAYGVPDQERQAWANRLAAVALDVILP